MTVISEQRPKASSSGPLLSVRNLTGLFAKPLDLLLYPGECVTVTGASGTGKTRLLRAIADLDMNIATVRLRGESREANTPERWRTRVAYVPTETAWWADSVAEHFLMVCSDELLAVLGFDPRVLSWDIHRLSSGERQRLGLLRALALEPEVLLLDEPTANLDEANTRRVETLVLDYLRQRAGAALWITHDAGQRQRVSKRTLELIRGGWKINP